MISDKVTLLPISQIVVDEARRRSVDPAHVENLAASIARDDLIHTIVVEEESLRLCAGLHRLQAWHLNARNKVPCPKPSYSSWTLIPTRIASNYRESDLARIELIENLQHRQLSWQDEVVGVAKVHNLQSKLVGGWTTEQTATLLGTSRTYISRLLTLAETDLADPQLAECPSANSAYLIIQRRNERQKAAKMEALTSGKSIFVPSVEHILSGRLPESEKPKDETPPEIPESPIRCASFLDFAPTYSGPRFNFLHCDFPYGISLDKSVGQGTRKDASSYDDSEEIYWTLLECLATNASHLLADSCHIMFWYSQNLEDETKDFFRRQMPEFHIQSHKMIWGMTDGSGLVPDTQRYGRRNYETALCLVSGDRKIVKIADLFQPFPGSGQWRAEALHRSEKPLPLLRKFFQMFVDENSVVLDPTCGSGTSLRAASALGAQTLVGLEIDPEMARRASEAFIRHQQSLEAMSKVQGL